MSRNLRGGNTFFRAGSEDLRITQRAGAERCRRVNQPGRGGRCLGAGEIVKIPIGGYAGYFFLRCSRCEKRVGEAALCPPQMVQVGQDLPGVAQLDAKPLRRDGSATRQKEVSV